MHLKDVRKAQGLTQQELSRLSAVSQQVISYHERYPGKRGPHRINGLKLALTLGVDVVDLFPGACRPPAAAAAAKEGVGIHAA